MSEELIKKMMEDAYDDEREDNIRSMLKDFYSKKMLSTAILVWAWALVFLAGAVYTGIQFFNTDQVRAQIMYAALFIVCTQGVSLMKIFAWEVIHRNSIKREIKRLELRIVEMAKTFGDKS